MDSQTDRCKTVGAGHRVQAERPARGAGGFVFDSKGPLIKLSDEEILEGLRRFVRAREGRRLTMKGFDCWPERPCSDDTIMKRFGTWREALRRIGVEGGRARRYSPEFMVEVLEKVWRKVGRRPGEPMLWKHARVTPRAFTKHWGTLRAACEAVDAFHRGRITREELLRGCPRPRRVRPPFPPSRRFAVLRRDGFRCKLCGRGAESIPPVELEVDHIVPVSKGGGDEESNLRALCRECNRGKGVGGDVDDPQEPEASRLTARRSNEGLPEAARRGWGELRGSPAFPPHLLAPASG